MRLQRYLAQCGIASRRHSEELILAGRVRVNGEIVRELGTQVDPEKDKVEFDRSEVTPPSDWEVWALNKPRGVVTTMRDPQGRKTVADLMRGKSGHRLVPVGRLDQIASGLLLMTDDGDLALRLTHPRWGVDKEYLVTVEGTLSREEQRSLCTGIEIEGRRSRFLSVKRASGVGPARQGCTRWSVVLHEGRYHLVRRLFEAVGHRVVGLHRPRVGPLELGTLKSGSARRLSNEEVAALRRAVDHSDGQKKKDPGDGSQRDRRH